MGEKTDRTARAIYALILLLFIAAAVVITDAPASLGKKSGLWLETLVILVLAAFLFEPNYSGTAASLANAVAGAFIVMGSQFNPLRAWWIAFGILSAIVAVLLIAERLLARNDRDSSSIASILRAVGMGLGTWRVLLVAGLALSLASFVRPLESPWGISLVTLLTTVVILELRPHRFFGRHRKPVLNVVSIWPPAEVLVGASDTYLAVGDALRLTSRDGASTEGLVVARSYAEGLATFRVYVPDLFTIRKSGDAETVRVEAISEPAATWIPRVRDDIKAGRARVVGLTTEGTPCRSLGSKLPKLSALANSCGPVVMSGVSTGK
jgi:hypothetical protein